ENRRFSFRALAGRGEGWRQNLHMWSRFLCDQPPLSPPCLSPRSTLRVSSGGATIANRGSLRMADSVHHSRRAPTHKHTQRSAPGANREADARAFGPATHTYNEPHTRKKCEG